MSESKKSFSLSDLVRIVLIAALIVAFVVLMRNKTEVTHRGDNPNLQEVTGKTMGTAYIIKIAEECDETERPRIFGIAGEKITNVDTLMSTFKPDSEISRFNASESTEWFPVSPETAKVVSLAKEVSDMTGGAFDITVGPLVNLWQFGPDRNSGRTIPVDEEIAKVREEIGYKKLEVRLDPPALKKSTPNLYIDLSGIAKGFAVDEAVESLLEQEVSFENKEYEIANLLVEIGGEVRAHGNKGKKAPWLLGISYPEPLSERLYTSIAIYDKALATSGGYENFREAEGVRFSHIIDPRTGRPCEWYPNGASFPDERLVSVSVVDAKCAKADALATGLFVLGLKEGMAVAEKNNLPVLFLARNADGKLKEYPSQQFKVYLPKKK